MQCKCRPGVPQQLGRWKGCQTPASRPIEAALAYIPAQKASIGTHVPCRCPRCRSRRGASGSLLAHPSAPSTWAGSARTGGFGSKSLLSERGDFGDVSPSRRSRCPARHCSSSAWTLRPAPPCVKKEAPVRRPRRLRHGGEFPSCRMSRGWTRPELRPGRRGSCAKESGGTR